MLDIISCLPFLIGHFRWHHNLIFRGSHRILLIPNLIHIRWPTCFDSSGRRDTTCDRNVMVLQVLANILRLLIIICIFQLIRRWQFSLNCKQLLCLIFFPQGWRFFWWFYFATIVVVIIVLCVNIMKNDLNAFQGVERLILLLVNLNLIGISNLIWRLTLTTYRRQQTGMILWIEFGHQ